jgi:hypothetical protein
VAGQAELTRQQRRSLAEHGYLLLPSILDADVVAALAARLNELARAAAGVRPSGPAPGLLSRAQHQRAVAGAGRHVVHHRIHPRQRAAAGDPRLASLGP